jgi:hypothetical protein
MAILLQPQGVTGFSANVLSQLCAKLRAKLVLRVLRDLASLGRDREALVEQAGEGRGWPHAGPERGIGPRDTAQAPGGGILKSSIETRDDDMRR